MVTSLVEKQEQLAQDPFTRLKEIMNTSSVMNLSNTLTTADVNDPRFVGY